MNHIPFHLARLILPLLLLPLLLACQRGDPAVDALHRTADSLMQSRADSALLLLQACDSVGVSPVSAPVDAWPRRQRMRHELLRAKAMNKAYVNFTTDSVMKEVADYYDSHGTPNERMEAHYLLGCAYRDLGEAPRAIDSYLDAVNCADTTAADCDYWLMASVYGQMANLYHHQLLLSYEIEAHQKACRYDLLASDTLWALHEQKMIACTYILQNKRDSAELMLNDVISHYKERGYEQEALLTSTMLMHIYMANAEKAGKLKALIEEYDSKSDDFDENHELHSKKRLFYRYKGKWFENTGQLDSAEYYYRKMYYRDMLLTEQNSMYVGLMSVFKKRHQPDSIAKYAQLYCAVNDSSIAIKDREVTAQLAASYKYNSIQKESNRNAEAAHRANLRFLLSTFLLLALIAITILLVHHYNRQRKLQRAKYMATIAERTKLRNELDSLNAKDYDGIIARKEKEIEYLNGIIAEHHNAYRNVMLKDKLSAFENSEIVRIINEKSDFRKGSPNITNDEWRELLSEFRKDMPAAYSLLKCLSPLQLYVCILLLLDYDESVIAILRQTKPQTINTAKKRANEKLFNIDDSASLSSNLKGALTA